MLMSLENSPNKELIGLKATHPPLSAAIIPFATNRQQKMGRNVPTFSVNSNRLSVISEQ
jgi:hypothetical protein